MPDGDDKVYVQEERPLTVGERIWSKAFTVTKIVKQPDKQGEGGVVKAKPS